MVHIYIYMLIHCLISFFFRIVYNLITLESIHLLIHCLIYFSGGPKGFSEVIWGVGSHDDNHVTFTYNSFDGEEGNVS